ncbi:UbiH/UbiF family hydroxylase [Neorhizobium alkalisoli]|uniref:2-octaprenyl-3-methyl-6-methoxy-1,4-benzoquinol hydroxylase n=1 Tax=Neorhizobium alkalisoli TaxID=528178 RepID=A0A561Q7P0_9HYPH|nr:UbiH/UbiF family hydroxylase [Neorhizobium alkalisoli]TWF46404.1 2-octaprenyl-3-methyl-6-methoxy-1,4-benzoquinol hydroxylase [Neorhizobium alkalisoli]
MQEFEIAVVGAGLAGSIAALALGRAGRKVALIAPPASGDDDRTTALMDHSIRFLDRLGLWEKLSPTASPLATMQIIDGTERLLRAPTTQFRASDVGLSAFGYNMLNRDLLTVLDKAVADEPNVTRFSATVESYDFSQERAGITLADGQALTVDLVVGADGRKSPAREAAGISARRWSYPQSALVLNFSHTVPHGSVSTEFHTETGPFTQVPLRGMRSSLVWVVRPEEAQRLFELDRTELSRLVEERMQSMLGKVTVDADPQVWPLSSLMADRFGKGRLALVGEAAHAFPPIGAQGLNLSLRDIITLSDLLATATGRPIAADIGEHFNRRRRPDIMSRTFGVDLLNRSLLSDFLPMQMLRAGGLHVLKNASPIRNLLMREGIEPGRGLRALAETLRPRPFRKEVRR